MRALLALLALLIAAPAFAQPSQGPYGPGPCPFGASSCQVTATGATTADTLANMVFPHVATNAVLLTKPSTYSPSVIRDDFAANVGAQPTLYKSSASACSLNTGNGDNGYQVKASDGGCWIATIGPYTDFRLWGGIGTSDDTAIITKADAALAAGMPQTIFVVSGTMNIVSAVVSNMRRVTGNNGTLNLAASGITTSTLFTYNGAGPFEVDHLTFSAPLYDPTTVAAPAGVQLLRLSNASVGSIDSVYAHDLKFIGGATNIQANGLIYARFEDIQSDRAWANGLVIGPYNPNTGSLGAAVQHIYVRNYRCRGVGSYCVSTPNNTTGPALTPRDIYITDVDAEGGGFIGSKYCYDFSAPAGAVEQYVIKATAHNCALGGAEIKQTVTGSTVVPAIAQNLNADITYFSHIDTGSGVALNNEALAVGADLTGRYKVTAHTTWTAPGAWQASTSYDTGDIATNGGNTYRVVTPGTSAASVGPTGTGTGAGASVADGTVVWAYVEATPSASDHLAAMQVKGLSNLDLYVTAQNTSYGVLLYPEGSSDRTIRNVDLHLSGDVNNACLFDLNTLDAANKVGTIDKFRLIEPRCHAVNHNNNGALNIGYSDSSGYTTNWTNFQIIGGYIHGDKAGIYGGNTGGTPASVAVTVSGGFRVVGATNAYVVNNTFTLTQTGGGSIETTDGASATAPIFTTASASSIGSFTFLGPVGVTNARNTQYPTWKAGAGSTLTVSGRFIDGFSAAAPTTRCNWGDIYNSTQPGSGGQPVTGWYCAAPDPTNTWTAF